MKNALSPLKSFDIEALDDPTLRVIDSIFAQDDEEASGVRPMPLYVSPCDNEDAA